MLRSAAIISLAFLASGVPSSLFAAIGEAAECESDCDRSLTDRDCPPNCTSGPCARIVLSLLAAPVELPRPCGQRARLASEDPARLPHGTVLGVFHPPRA